MSPWQILCKVELSLAAIVILAGIRTLGIINNGTAALASTVVAKTLGSPIIVGFKRLQYRLFSPGRLPGRLVTDPLFERLQRGFRSG